jgi:hypothetical protein
MTIRREVVALLALQGNQSHPDTRFCTLISRSCSHIRWPTGCAKHPG